MSLGIGRQAGVIYNKNQTQKLSILYSFRNLTIAPNVTISTTNHPLHYKLRSQEQMYCKEVVIGDHVWIGSNAVICAGVTIGNGAVIGAGSVVTRDIPPMTLAFGVPCRAIREITDEDLNAFDPIPGI